jgi:hypothetical protein
VTEIDGISEADFQVWKHHPVSKLYLKYLGDYRAALLRELLERWEAGSLVLDTEKEIRGRTMTLADLVELKFASIQTFYQRPEEDNATEVAQVIAET